MEGFEAILESVRQEIATTAALDDGTMKVTTLELARARAIKAAVEANPEISPRSKLSDFEYMQYALTTEGESIEQVCNRVYRQQAFKEEYKIEDTATQGIQLFHLDVLQRPGVWLAVEYLTNSENCVAVCDYAAFHPPTTDEEYTAHASAIYYLYQCLAPNFRCIRNGMSSVVECSGASLANLNLRFTERLVVEFLSSYPHNIHEVFFLSAESTVTMVMALWNRCLPERFKKNIHLGRQIEGMEGRRIDILYKVPTEEAAKERLIMKTLQLLTLRDQHQKTFTFSSASVLDGGI